MAHREPPFSESDLSALAKCLAGAATHSEFSSLFRDAGLPEQTPTDGTPKWMRIYNAFAHAQNSTQTGNLIMKFVQTVLAPRRFVQGTESYDIYRNEVNQLLAFRGWHLYENGKFGKVSSATTIDEAKARAGRLRAELERRHVHPDVLSFCRAELLQDNFFHAVLEATKSVSEKIRIKSGLKGDAGELATKALSSGQAGMPFLAFNMLSNDTEKSEQSGLMNLFVGMFGAFRNTTAHGAKISWNITEHDALDLLTLVSLLHRRLDASIVTGRQI